MILTNAHVLLTDEAIHGSVVIDGSRIVDIRPGRGATAGALDMEGDFLLPGAVDLHTDNLERQVAPRSNARWPSRAAFAAHDAQCAAAGITTVLDALWVGQSGFDEDRQRTCLEGIADLETLSAAGLLKCEHFLHLRCELPAAGVPEMVGRLAVHPALKLVSLMDHTPGSGQYADLTRYRAMRAGNGETAAATEARIAALIAQRARLRDSNRAEVLTHLRAAGVTVASHDDRTEAEVAENFADGIRISEFPVTQAAAAAARAAGMAIIGGAPNIVRGGSHTGNVTARALLQAGLLDGLASDYVPASLIHAAFIIAAQMGLGLPRAMRLVSEAPARIAGFADRGQIATGFLADLVRVRLVEGLPVVRAVFRHGERVA